MYTETVSRPCGAFWMKMNVNLRKKKKKQELLLLFMHEICVGGYWQVTSLSGKERQTWYYRNISALFQLAHVQPCHVMG